MVLNNEKAAEMFSAAGYQAFPEEVLPVKLERIAFRKTHTEMRIVCWKLETHERTIFLRMDNGKVFKRPQNCACIGLEPSEGAIFDDEIIVTMTYFSPSERRFRFECKYEKNVRYLRMIVPEKI